MYRNTYTQQGTGTELLVSCEHSSDACEKSEKYPDISRIFNYPLVSLVYPQSTYLIRMYEFPFFKKNMFSSNLFVVSLLLLELPVHLFLLQQLYSTFKLLFSKINTHMHTCTDM